MSWHKWRPSKPRAQAARCKCDLGNRSIKKVAMRDSGTTRFDDTARVRADAESRPLGGRRKWSTGLTPFGWVLVLGIVALIAGAVLALAT
jgi:hypothetical protein